MRAAFSCLQRETSTEPIKSPFFLTFTLTVPPCIVFLFPLFHTNMRPNYTALPFLFNLLAFVLASLLGARAVAALSSDRCAAFDFNALRGAENTTPQGLWSDGITMWVADYDDAKIFAYDLTTKARDASKDFDTLSAAGNTTPQGLWSDGTTMWVVDYDDAKIFAYDLTTKAHDASKDFDTLSAAGNTTPRGLWSDGTTMWVADWVDAKIFAYDLTTKAHYASRDFDTLRAAKNNDSYGLWSDGITMWVAENEYDAKLYAYDLMTKARDPYKDFDTLNVAGNYSPQGLWSDGITMWVVEKGYGAKIYAYSSLCPPGVVVTSRTSDSLTISWTNVAGHTYVVSRNGGVGYGEVESVGTHTFTGLSPDTEYRLRIKVTNSEGSSAESSIVGHRTTPATQATLASKRCADFIALRGAGNDGPRGLWPAGSPCGWWIGMMPRFTPMT